MFLFECFDPVGSNFTTSKGGGGSYNFEQKHKISFYFCQRVTSHENKFLNFFLSKKLGRRRQHGKTRQPNFSKNTNTRSVCYYYWQHETSKAFFLGGEKTKGRKTHPNLVHSKENKPKPTAPHPHHLTPLNFLHPPPHRRSTVVTLIRRCLRPPSPFIPTLTFHI